MDRPTSPSPDTGGSKADPPVAPVASSRRLVDSFGRQMGYLRLSITDRCNLNCTYCRPEREDPSPARREEILNFEEILRLVGLLAEMGITKIRVTGGEPLVRKNSIELMHRLSSIPAVEELTLTTNALLLPRFAEELVETGLKRVNLSLDTLRPERFKELTRGGELEQVIAGIDAAIKVGLTPIRFNAVLMRGFNDDELADLIDFAVARGITARFIECMPMKEGLDWESMYVPIDEVLKMPEIQARVDTSSRPQRERAGSASFYLPLKNAKGKVGFISPISRKFCEGCNRLRLTADGRLRSCLPSDSEMDLRAAIRKGADDKEIIDLIKQAVRLKPEVGVYAKDQPGTTRTRSMIDIGG